MEDRLKIVSYYGLTEEDILRLVKNEHEQGWRPYHTIEFRILQPFENTIVPHKVIFIKKGKKMK